MKFLQDLPAGRLDEAVAMLRSTDGSPLPPEAVQRLIANWHQAFSPGRGEVHLTGIQVTGKTQLSGQDLTQLHAQAGYQIDFNTEGTSSNPCFKAPVSGTWARVIEQGGKWYIVEQMDTQFMLLCPSS